MKKMLTLTVLEFFQTKRVSSKRTPRSRVSPVFMRLICNRSRFYLRRKNGPEARYKQAERVPYRGSSSSSE